MRADAFPGGVLVFDAANRTAVKMIAKTWLRTAKIKDVGAYFAVSDAKSELSPWDSRLQVSSKGYMLGYDEMSLSRHLCRIRLPGVVPLLLRQRRHQLYRAASEADLGEKHDAGAR